MDFTLNDSQDSSRGPTANEGKKKNKKDYEIWTTNQTTELRELLVEATLAGYRDNSGAIARHIVDSRILPGLNRKMNCNKNYAHYQSRWRWFKNRYSHYRDALAHSSGFGWDPVTKKFEADDEVWDDFLRSHPKAAFMRHEDVSDYEDLKLIVGNVMASGGGATSIGGTRPPPRVPPLEDVVFDNQGDGYVGETGDDDFVRSPTVDMRSPTPPVERVERIERVEGSQQSKRSRTTMSGRAVDGSDDSRDVVASGILKMTSIMEKRDKENTWNDIMEIPDLDEDTQFWVGEILQTQQRKDMFHTMTIQKRKNWIEYMKRTTQRQP